MSLIYDTKANKTKYLVDLEDTGKTKQSTLLSMSSSAPSGTFAKGSKYYNSNTKLIYTAIDDNTWTGAKTSNPEFGVIYIYSNNGTTTYYQWDGDNLVETDLEKYQLISNISNDYIESSKNKYPSSFALYKGLGSVRPNTVTNSGASLPATTDYNLGDTFLNTTDKKLYTTKADAYELNTGVTTSSASVDLQTGVANNFEHVGSSSGYIRRSNVINWSGNAILNFHIKINQTRGQVIASLSSGSGQYRTAYFYLKDDMKLYCGYADGYNGPSTQRYTYFLADYQLSLNTEYFIRIEKNSSSITTTIFVNGYDLSEVYTNTVEDTIDWSYGTGYLQYGSYGSGPVAGISNQTFLGDIYLLDSTGNFLKASGVLAWDSGESLIDLAQYADTTNGIMYFYANNQLFYSHVDFANIGGVPSDNTALNTVLNSKQDNLPDQTGNNGKVLSTDGTNLIWSTVSGGGGAPIIEYFTNISGVTFDPTPFILGTVNIIYKNGLLLQPTEDYTLNGNEITFVEILNNDNITIMKW